MSLLSKATALLLLTVVVVTTGCGRVVFTPKAQQAQALSLSPEQQQTLAAQMQQLQQRADALDRDNQELEAIIAQRGQQLQLQHNQALALQEQLKATTDRLAAVQSTNTQLEQRTQALTASVQQMPGAEIRANNTLLKSLQSTNVPGVTARQDGDTIRVALAGDMLFVPGSPQLQSGAEQTLRTVATDLMTNYPDHLIGIEGHTDPMTPASPQYSTPHHLSVAQSTAVYDLLVRSLGVSPQQLFVIGHGANHPVVSNATAAGQAQNRRIELVIYPETTRSR
ncbi:OmpA/MotB family protein [Aeoliella mucimassa]|uniref:Outer membrane porin F n=1 Tax=Aeoliella mucimassa TaxID=2527972 RepID=A0A518ALG1_9BACT|nr:OmpA family protein [Aeoliella mucimassa]QDU55536.1 Outer membrane porin F precursor [Aeoliella mucimassa]